MTHSIRGSHEHGILDERADTEQHTRQERIVDRRRFLAHLGAGALGAALLNFRDPTSALASALSGPTVGGAGAAAAVRPIYMVALGDSVMWGQGLSDAQKFQAKVAQWIQTTHPDRRQVQRWNFAHSGATIGGLAGLGPSAYSTGQMTAAVFGRLASANRGRDVEGMPEFEPRRLRDSSTTPPAPTPPVAPNHGRPNEPREADRLSGEIPRSFPSLWRQLDLALETLRTGRDPRNPQAPAGQPVDPADVDLVLLNGGANDVNFLGTIMNLGRNSQQTYEDVRGVVEPRMREYLPKVLEAFPRATIVMTTYYQGISHKSSAAALTPLVELSVAAQSLTLPLAVIVGGKVVDNQIGAIIGRNDAMERAISDSYRAVVASAPPGRVHIVNPGFAPENGYGAPQSFLFHIEDVDPVERPRIAECDALLGQWFNDNVLTTKPSRVDTPLWVLCRDASTFHPNVAGAQHYFTKIRDTLVRASPAFMRPLPKLRVVVSGSVAGETKTVTVTAFDEQSGQPVNGTVSIAGVTGRTGAPISYTTAGCAIEAGPAPAAGAAGPGPVGRPLGGRGRVAPAPVAKALGTCSGRVSVEGYGDATFKY